MNTRIVQKLLQGRHGWIWGSGGTALVIGVLLFMNGTCVPEAYDPNAGRAQAHAVTNDPSVASGDVNQNNALFGSGGSFSCPNQPVCPACQACPPVAAPPQAPECPEGSVAFFGRENEPVCMELDVARPFDLATVQRNFMAGPAGRTPTLVEPGQGVQFVLRMTAAASEEKVCVVPMSPDTGTQQPLYLVESADRPSGSILYWCLTPYVVPNAPTAQPSPAQAYSAGQAYTAPGGSGSGFGAGFGSGSGFYAFGSSGSGFGAGGYGFGAGSASDSNPTTGAQGFAGFSAGDSSAAPVPRMVEPTSPLGQSVRRVVALSSGVADVSHLRVIRERDMFSFITAPNRYQWNGPSVLLPYRDSVRPAR